MTRCRGTRKSLPFYRQGSIAKSFQKYAVDRLKIVKTAEIAKLAIAAPAEFEQVDKRGTVAEFAQICKEVIRANQAISAKINKMKHERKLICIYKKKSLDRRGID